MTISHGRTVDCPERSAEQLLDRFAGDLATVERYIVDEELAAALRRDDYDSYLHWRRIKSICAGLAAERRLADARGRASARGASADSQLATAA